jgi:hypothetical protein
MWAMLSLHIAVSFIEQVAQYAISLVIRKGLREIDAHLKSG